MRQRTSRAATLRQSFAAGEPVLDLMVQARACFLTEDSVQFLPGIKTAWHLPCFYLTSFSLRFDK